MNRSSYFKILLLQEEAFKIESILGLNVETATLEHLLPIDHLDDIEKDYVLKVTKGKKDRFSCLRDELLGTDLVMHRISKIDEEPIKRR